MNDPGGPTAGRLSDTDRTIAATLGALFLWIVIAAARAGTPWSGTIAYLLPPLVVAVGLLLGRWCAWREARRRFPGEAAVLLLLILVALPDYANAAAAVGIQMVALAGLLLTGGHGTNRSRHLMAPRVFAAGIGAGGILLAASSQAASVLVVAAVVFVAAMLSSRTSRSRRVVLGAGLGCVGAAVLILVMLTRMPQWPRWLRDSRSLSGTRHGLWNDALALWYEHPVLGAGPGSFLEHSEIARSEDHLYATHSSVLQVAAELGGIGVVLFLAVLVAGALVAAQGETARGLIGVTAWCSLAVHSMIDHLYEFPIICLLAGFVIGMAGSRRAPEPLPPRPKSSWAQ